MLRWSLIKVKGLGINRSEIFTRKGYLPSVKFPRIIGIECVLVEYFNNSIIFDGFEIATESLVAAMIKSLFYSKNKSK